MAAAGEGPFGLVFIDADKPRYVEYLRLALELTQSESLIVADKVIRNRRVLDPYPVMPTREAPKRSTTRWRRIPGSNRLSCRSTGNKLDSLSISRVK